MYYYYYYYGQNKIRKNPIPWIGCNIVCLILIVGDTINVYRWDIEVDTAYIINVIVGKF